MQMVNRMRDVALAEPAYTSNWGMLALETTWPFPEVVIAGPEVHTLRKALQSHYLPLCQVMGGESKAELPLVADKFTGTKSMIYVCVNKTCQLPVATVREALDQLSSLS